MALTPNMQANNLGLNNINSGRMPMLATAPAINASTYTPAKVSQHAPTPVAANTAAQQSLTPGARVSTSLNNLTASNSPYLQAAKTRALQMGNRRGLLNSSMTTGAAEAAAINSALPIAQGDAANEARQSLQNQQNQQQSGLSNTLAANNMSQFDSRAKDAIGQQNASFVNNAGKFNAQQSNAVDQGNQNISAKYDLQNQQTVQQLQQSATSASTAIMSSYMDAYNAIQINPKLSSPAKRTALANIKEQGRRASLALRSINSAAVNMPSATWR